MLANLIAAAPFRRTISFPRKRDGFHIMPTSCGQEIASGRAYDWDGFRRGSTPFSVLQHTISGEGRLRYGQRSFDLGPGDTMLVTIPHDHRYWLPRGRTWRFFWIAFSGQEALRLHRAVIDMAGPVFRLSPATLDRLAADCLQLRDGARTAGFASALAYGATMALHDDLMSAIGTDDPTATHHADINRTVAFIKSHVAQHLDVASLAGVAGMSRAHFTRVFKRHLGMTPAEFVLRERMERAAKLLSDSRLTVKRVSIASGFKDPNYFSKAFRRTFSISPAEFRTTGMFASRSPS